jgi:hypothetical protein
MSDWQKAAIGIAGALLVGFVAGFLLGGTGKGDLEQRLAAAKTKAAAIEEESKKESSRCEQQGQKARATRLLLLAKEHLLRAAVDLHANNYGLSGAQLGRARSRLKAAQGQLKPKQRQQVNGLFEDLATVHTLVMRQDPMARTQLENLLGRLQMIPAAR